MKIDLNKEYETEDKWPVVLLTDDAPGSYPFVGYRINPTSGFAYPEAWTESGESQNRRFADLKPKQTLAEKLQPQIPWEWLPNEIVCVAMDDDGQWFGYLSEPTINPPEPCWQGRDMLDLEVIKMPTVPAKRWKETLVFRPEGDNQ